MSTNTAKKAPSVPVCSVGCEAKYLELKGMRPSSKACSPDSKHCVVCHGPNLNYSVSSRGSVVSVCSKECEESFLRRKKRRGNADTNENTTFKHSKGEQAEPINCQRRTLTFLSDQLLESSEGGGYKSWWLGALTYYDFVYQRHGMWHSYSISNDVPRVDQCLIKFASCNIYRELDRSTAYLRKYVLRWQQSHQGRLGLREVLWMSVVFRLCNQLETFHKLKGIPSSDSFSHFKKRLLVLAKRIDDKHLLAGDRKLTVTLYLEALERFLKNIDDTTVAVKECTTSEGIFETLRNFQNNILGSFTCWQVVCDLMELHLLPENFIKDDFVWLSLDARKSLVQIFGKNRARPTEYVALAQLLQQRQLQGFKALQVSFPYFMNQKLDLKNTAHALHNFQVYRNMKLIENKQSYKLEPGTTQPVLYSSRTYMMDSEHCEVCAHPENEDELVLCDLCQRMFHKYCISMKELPAASWVCATCKKLQNYPHEGMMIEQEIISVD
ncbi:protein phf-isoform b [Plasmopara halstedii]|uniref:Protein phf-isoform b n=1 Tax=Plasmopara halstedii TaxID=4781 RepID=A0A0P1AHT5_PLAHL|nr:protein phf-isoform b [Plasmopara halstedii]CEG40040.1 protein phf-isoform b [Plasmopara halstedii]|eukprot:XP_024576409.1 protein phf-isoform b [Plasmopara halstedii]